MGLREEFEKETGYNLPISGAFTASKKVADLVWYYGKRIEWLEKRLTEQTTKQPIEPRKYTVQELEDAKDFYVSLNAYFSSSSWKRGMDIAIHLIQKEIVYLRDKK